MGMEASETGNVENLLIVERNRFKRHPCLTSLPVCVMAGGVSKPLRRQWINKEHCLGLRCQRADVTAANCVLTLVTPDACFAFYIFLL